jgi:hypothetical protein
VSMSRMRPKANSVRVPTMEAQRNSSSNLVQSPEVACTKIDSPTAYRVCFECSLYGWNQNSIELPMESVSGPNSFEVNRDR